MDVYRTEEEQIEAIQKWWKDNGLSTVMGVVLVLAMWFGWNGWKTNQQESSEASSDIYQELLIAVEQVGFAEEAKQEVQKSTATHLAKQLKEEYSATTYARFAALLMAKQAVEADELDKAVEELNWVLGSRPDKEFMLIAKLRLARVLMAQAKYDESLTLIENVDAGALQAQYEETKGDIYLSQGRKDEARQAYNQSSVLIKANSQNQRGLSSVVEMKANDLTPLQDNLSVNTTAE